MEQSGSTQGEAGLSSRREADDADLVARVHRLLVDDDDARLCRDIPEEACEEQPRNFMTHVVSLGATKTGDGLADPKLVLAWLLGALGAPAAAIGLLVPVRESLALLPQLFTSAQIRSMPLRKWAWAGGSLVQGLCVLAMAAVALTLDGAVAGWTIVGLLAVFALARSVCSVSYKDVLGKTVAKQTRGSAKGAASSIASAMVLLFGLALSFGVIPLTVSSIVVVLLVAGGLWLVAAGLFARIEEVPGAVEGGRNGWPEVVSQLSLLSKDLQLVRFISVRGLLTATALAPPFVLALAGQSGGREISQLGPFVVASSLASVLSSYVWGRFADRSSRRVLIASGLSAAVILALLGGVALVGPEIGTHTLIMAGGLFFLVVSYQGVRLGRSTHLVDMANEDTRAAYTALSNTAIGVILLAGGVFGLVASAFGTPVVLLVFAAMCAGAAALGLGLDEVQAEGAGA